MKKKNNKFAFMVHPENFDRLHAFLGKYSVISRSLPKYTVKKIIEKIPPFKIQHLKKIKSAKGAEIEGIIILCPFFPEQFVALRRKLVLDKIIKAGKIAEEYGAKIIGLAGFCSIFSNQGLDLRNNLKIPVTTGNSFTAAMVIKNVLNAANKLGKRLDQSTLAIIGATGDIGSICASEFADHVRQIVLAARDEQRLNRFALHNLKDKKAEIVIEKSDTIATQKADILITSTSSIATIVNSTNLKKGTIVCDVSVPPNVARSIAQERQDVFVFEGGYSVAPFFNNFDYEFKKHFRFKSIFGCLAETLILTFEEKFEDFSIGRGNITNEKLRLITKLGEDNGFIASPFFCGNKLYTEDDINCIKKNCT